MEQLVNLDRLQEEISTLAAKCDRYLLDLSSQTSQHLAEPDSSVSEFVSGLQSFNDTASATADKGEYSLIEVERHLQSIVDEIGRTLVLLEPSKA